ncbi:MAG: hypothetical protein ABSB78_04180 [Bacteroidota bacterium]
MKNEPKNSNSDCQASRREQVLNEASERLLGISKKANNNDPAHRTQEVIKLLESLQDRDSNSSK